MLMNCLHFRQKSIGWYFDFLGCAYPYFSFLLWDSPCNTIYKFLYCVICIIMSVQFTVLSCILALISKQTTMSSVNSKVIQNQTMHCWQYSGCTVLSSNISMNVISDNFPSHCHSEFSPAVSTHSMTDTAPPNVYCANATYQLEGLGTIVGCLAKHCKVCYILFVMFVTCKSEGH